MNKIFFRVLLSFWIAIIGSQIAQADNVKISDAWIRFAPPTVKAHAGYFQLDNAGAKERVIVGAQSPAYERVELHVSKVNDGIATMQKLEQVRVEPGKSLMFEPGGLHLMLIGPKEKQKEGESVSATLIFEDGSKVALTAIVKKSGMSHGKMKHGHDHGKMKHDGMKMN